VTVDCVGGMATCYTGAVLLIGTFYPSRGRLGMRRATLLPGLEEEEPSDGGGGERRSSDHQRRS
jgi:hypothetical protein